MRRLREVTSNDDAIGELEWRVAPTFSRHEKSTGVVGRLQTREFFRAPRLWEVRVERSQEDSIGAWSANLRQCCCLVELVSHGGVFGTQLWESRRQR